jgi:hypothetical protein
MSVNVDTAHPMRPTTRRGSLLLPPLFTGPSQADVNLTGMVGVAPSRPVDIGARDFKEKR